MHEQFTRGNGRSTVQGAPISLAVDVPQGAGRAAATTRVRGGVPFDAGQVTEITHITTKQDLARWTRAHEGVSGITWSVFAGEGGTMVIVELGGRDRSAAVGAGAPAPVPVLAGAGAR